MKMRRKRYLGRSAQPVSKDTVPGDVCRILLNPLQEFQKLAGSVPYFELQKCIVYVKIYFLFEISWNRALKGLVHVTVNNLFSQ